ncbi:MAG: hypothetical protein AABZ33_09745 [Chloroflexota bacterium]
MTLPPPQMPPPREPGAQAAPPGLVLPEGSGRSVWDRLRQARANVQGLQTSVGSLASSGDRFAEVLEQERALWATNERQVDRDLSDIQEAVEAGAAEPDEIGDELTQLDNDWDRAKAYWNAFVEAPPADTGERDRRLGSIDALLSAVVYRVAILTIPRRVQAYLERQRIGGAFDFHAAFRDELPLESQRVDVLRYLAGSPVGIYGIIDVGAGVIWAGSPDPGRQRRSYVVIAGIAAAGLILTVGAAQLAVGGPFVSARTQELAVAYVLVAAGVLGHLAIDLYKQSRSADRTGRWTAIDDLVLWGHTHEMQMYITALSVWAGLVLLAFTFDNVAPATAFIAGYSLDSFLDAGLLRFSNTIDAGTKSLRTQVGGGQ